MHFFKGKLGQVYRNNLTTYRQMFYSEKMCYFSYDHIRMSLLKKKQPKKKIMMKRILFYHRLNILY